LPDSDFDYDDLLLLNRYQLLFKSLGKQSASVAPEVAQMEIEEI